MIVFDNIISSDLISFEIVPQLPDQQIKIGQVELIIGDNYQIIQNKNIVDIKLKNEAQKYEIDNRLMTSEGRLSNIGHVNNNNGVATISVKTFYSSILEMDEVEIGIDEKIEKSARNQGFDFSKTDELCNKLTDLVNIANVDNYFILTIGYASIKDFELIDEEYPEITNNDVENDNEQEESFEMVPEKSGDIVSNDMRCFMIYGDGFKIPVERKIINDKEIFFASRIINNPNNNDDKAAQLAKGKVTFSNYTATGEIQRIARGQMESLFEDEDGYLKKWDEYGAIEGTMLLEQAREIGAFGYHNSEIVDGGVKFYLNETIASLLKVGDELELTIEKPPYLEDEEMTWEEYENYLGEEYKNTSKIKVASEKKSEEPTQKIENHAKIIDMSDNWLVLEITAKPKDKNLSFILSINGEKWQIKRRMRARELIKEGRCANPMLGPLIEEGGNLPGTERTSKIKPLTSFVKEKIFKYDPTSVQEEAINIALNTPDMALIQGPPGTGKTTVITAIIERLNEEFYKAGESIKGKILVTGYQHDAVENIVSRLSVNALPSIKFGKKSESGFTEDAVSHKIEAWCKKIARRIREKNPIINESEEQLKLRELSHLYALQPSDENAISLLDQIIDMPRNKLQNENLIKKTTILKSSLKNVSNISSSNKLEAVSLLRVTKTGFADDGPQRASDVIEHCEYDLDDSMVSLFKKAILWKKSSPLNFLNQLKKVKKELLIRYTPKPFYKINKPRMDIIKITAQVQKQLENQLGAKNKKENLLANFLHELEDNPKGVEEALAAYNVVFASTVQQSEGKDIRKAKIIKRKIESTDLIEYDVVLVDEAARVSPRDLLIPMAQGKKVILVGDHRQLPHLLNEAVVKRLESTNEEDKDGDVPEIDYVKHSMFRYLFNRLKKIEEADNIPRTVTLDAQFRMHPLLGNFVSEQFYSKNERFRSPLKSEEFEHSLSNCENQFAVWLDVPSNKGKESQTSKKSRLREAEAKSIAKQLNDWIKSEAGKKLTFGVISFYKAQVYTVYLELEKYGITHKDSDGNWQINDDYLRLDGDSSKEKLRIGTVDSFQGMEFDVVFLSIVRSQNEQIINKRLKKSENEHWSAMGLFGHLMSENRLCVSMSRQKKVLVAVGDAKMFQMEIAEQNVPALYNYYILSKDEGVVFQ